jgi:DNA-binding NarL/FixJ family response regulator
VSPALDSILTPREVDVVRAISRGLMNQEIANELGISAQTVRHHLKSIFAKLGLSSRLELALLASKNRL